jgi:drug/metabolite transporter (DMT)-like permease
MRAAHANILLVGCAVIWGVSFLFQKTAMAHLPPLQFIAARCALAALVLAPFAWLERGRADAGNGEGLARAILLAGTVFFFAALLQQRGIVTASVTNSAFLTSLYVIVTPFLAWAMLGQRPARTMWIAVLLSACGAWLLGGGGPAVFGAGELTVVTATVLWALHVIVLGWAAPRGNPITLTAGQFALVAVLAFFGALMFETPDLAGLASASTEIIYVGIFAGALTFTIFTMALRCTSATAATVIASTEAPFAAIAAYMVLGEQLSIISVLGAMLMVAAALVMHMPAEPRP